MAICCNVNVISLPLTTERLTVEMARRAGPDRSASAVELPKIEGKVLPQKPN